VVNTLSVPGMGRKSLVHEKVFPAGEEVPKSLTESPSQNVLDLPLVEIVARGEGLVVTDTESENGE